MAMEEMEKLTDVIFFDTDCLSSFIVAHRENVLLQVCGNNIKIPQIVIEELKAAPDIYNSIDVYIKKGKIGVIDFDFGDEVYKLYEKLTVSPDKGHKIIGDGEAAVLALAKVNNGVVASNNLKDIADYIKEYNLQYITTGEILREALKLNIIDEKTGNKIWNDMKQKRRFLPDGSFSDYIKTPFQI